MTTPGSESQTNAVAAARPRAPASEIPSRVLLVRLDNTGDVVLLSPVIAALRLAWPHAEFTLLASPAGAQAAPLLPGIERVIVHSASWQQLRPGSIEPGSERALLEELAQRQFDVALIFTSFAQSPVAPAYLCYLAEIPVRAAFATPQFSGEVITHPVPGEDAPPHQADRNLFLLEGLGLPVTQRDLALVPSFAAQGAATEVLRTAGIDVDSGEDSRFAVLVPGASAPARRYPAERFGVAARDLARTLGLRVLVLGSERERALCEQVVEAAGDEDVVAIAGRTSVEEAAALIARSCLVIANNSLALHLADAARVPVVATYAGTDPPAYWRPRAAPYRLLAAEVPCAPCFRIECDRGHECLDVGPELLVAAARELFAAAPSELRA